MMHRRLCTVMATVVAAALGTGWLFSSAQAAIVEAEQWTNVLVEASSFDSRVAAEGGCDPAGCLPTLTRDGDSISSDSRWSCSPSMGPEEAECWITFEMKKKLDVKGLRVAMHDGNSGARAKFAIRVNEELVMTWVSSGETAGFEFVPLVSKKVHLIELRAVLGRDEWINLSEVEVLTESVHEEEMMQAAMEVAMNDAIDYNMKMHAYHAGRPQPPRNSRVTLVTQCSADRLGAVFQQAVKWAGDISLAVLVPSAPVWETAEALAGVRQLVEDVDKAWATDPKLNYLSVDIAVLEGAEAHASKQDHCGALYPVNTLRNLALLQTRNEDLHPGPVVFLVDSDFAPSANLRNELGSPEIQRRLLDGFPAPERRHNLVDSLPQVDSEDSAGAPATSGSDKDVEPHRTVIAVVPCMEFVDGIEEIDNGRVGIPRLPEEAADLLHKGFARGFHMHRVAASHGPTDFERWANETRNDFGGGFAYNIPYYPRFEPYVALAKAAVPLYDERFRGYANNKLAHILALALGGYPAPPQLSGTTQTGTSSTWDTTNSVVHSADSISTFEGSRVKRACAEFTVIRRGFVFHQPHPASNAWEATYGGERDALRAYQIRHLWLTFLMEVRAGVPPAISANTENIMLAMRLSNPPLGRVLTSPKFVRVDAETGNDARWLAFRRDASYLIGGQRRVDPLGVQNSVGPSMTSRSGVNGVVAGAGKNESGSGGRLGWAQWLRTAVCLVFFYRIMVMGRARWCSS